MHIPACSVVISIYQQCIDFVQTSTTYVDHSIILTRGSTFSLNLIGRAHIPMFVRKTMPEWPDPPLLHAGDVIHPVLQKGVAHSRDYLGLRQ